MALHAMLEFNDIETTEQITDLFTRLDECGLSTDYLASVLQQPSSRVAGWKDGINIPNEESWPSIAASLKEVISGVVQAGWENNKN